MVLGKLSVPLRPTNLDNSRTRLVQVGVVRTFFLSSIISLSFSLSLGDGPKARIFLFSGSWEISGQT